MITVVPHPGATLPYSEFKGLSKVPNVVTLLVLRSLLVFDVVPVAISFRCDVFLLSVTESPAFAKATGSFAATSLLWGSLPAHRFNEGTAKQKPLRNPNP